MKKLISKSDVDATILHAHTKYKVPFTFSHPAAVLPLTFLDKKRLSATALAVGSVTPDFEYFANFEQHSIYSHTWLGILWFNLPLAIILFFIYTLIVKDELIDNLPGFLNARLSRFKNVKGFRFSTQKLLIVVTSLLIGITSHLLWDRLVHKTVAGLADEPTELYPVFWDANSVIGAAIMAIILWRFPKTYGTKRDGFLFWFLILSITLIAVLIRAAESTETRNLAVSLISGSLIGLIVSSAVSKLLRLSKPKRERELVMEKAATSV